VWFQIISIPPPQRESEILGGEGELGGGSKSGMIFNFMFSVVLKILVTISFDFDIN